MDTNDLEGATTNHSQNLNTMFNEKKLSAPPSINPTKSMSVVPVPIAENPVTSTPGVSVVENQVISASEVSAFESGKQSPENAKSTAIDQSFRPKIQSTTFHCNRLVMEKRKSISTVIGLRIKIGDLCYTIIQRKVRHYV